MAFDRAEDMIEYGRVRLILFIASLELVDACTLLKINGNPAAWSAPRFIREKQLSAAEMYPQISEVNESKHLLKLKLVKEKIVTQRYQCGMPRALLYV